MVSDAVFHASVCDASWCLSLQMVPVWEDKYDVRLGEPHLGHVHEEGVSAAPVCFNFMRVDEVERLLSKNNP